MIVSRFAPAPTGHLHLGHVVNALYVWGITRALGGRVLLRIEDHDRQRSRHEFEQQILDDLEWLGFVPDDPPIQAFRAGACVGRQSDRSSLYDAALLNLQERGFVYACACSRTEIGLVAPDGCEARYPGTCRGRSLNVRPGLGVRVRLEPSVERFDDVLEGRQEQSPHLQCGDLLVRDRHGNWSYQFAVTADDAAQGITLVIRGEDLLPSTGRQIQLGRLMGRDHPPTFLHHPLVMKSGMQKLSKADGDSGIRDMRDRGATPEWVIGKAAALIGLLPAETPVPASESRMLIQQRLPDVLERLARL